MNKQEYDRLRYLEIKDQVKERVKIWKEANKSTRWSKEKKLLEGNFQRIFYKSCLTLIKRYLRYDLQPKYSKTFKKLGYSIDELKNHLLSTMPENKNWNDFINGDLHIDHIKPHCLFTYTSHDDSDFKECWGLKNLQLLTKQENLNKHRSYEPATERISA